MDVYYDLPTDLPKHDPPPLQAHAARVLTTWPLGTFVENLIVRHSGDIVVSVHSENRLERIGLDGSHRTLAQLPAPPTSLIEDRIEDRTEDKIEDRIEDGDAVFVFGGIPGQSPGYLWRVGSDGEIQTRAEVREASFLNGSCPFFPGSALAVDSLNGTIYRFDLQTGQRTPWYAHTLLTKSTDFALMPGGNGMQIFDRHVYLSNTDRAILVRVPIQSDGSAGEIETVAEHLRADDFVFDADGFAYLTTHIENSLVRLAPNGERLAIAGAEQGMPGCTAVRFGRTPDTAKKLFVTTTGGLIGPYRGVAQEAKLVMVEVEAQAYPIDFLEGAK